MHPKMREGYSLLGTPMPSRRSRKSSMGGSRTPSHQVLSLIALPLAHHAENELSETSQVARVGVEPTVAKV